jgi:hypothetical protein
MATIFLLQNQHKLLLNKRGEWCDGREASTLYRTVHRDEALNQMVEANSGDYTLRLKILECETNDRGIPLLKDEELPPLGTTGTTLDADTDNVSAAKDEIDQDPTPSEGTPVATEVELKIEEEAAPVESPAQL